MYDADCTLICKISNRFEAMLSTTSDKIIDRDKLRHGQCY